MTVSNTVQQCRKNLSDQKCETREEETCNYCWVPEGWWVGGFVLSCGVRAAEMAMYSTHHALQGLRITVILRETSVNEHKWFKLGILSLEAGKLASWEPDIQIHDACPGAFVSGRVTSSWKRFPTDKYTLDEGRLKLSKCCLSSLILGARDLKPVIRTGNSLWVLWFNFRRVRR